VLIPEQPQGRDALQEYQSLRRAIDDFVVDVTRSHGVHIRCRRGCFLCCVPPETLFRVEGEQIRDAVLRLPEDVRERVRMRVQNRDRMLCPLLEDGQCLVYANRPLICRTQGMPLAVEEDGENFSLNYCPLNFTDVPGGYEVGRRHILNLDGTNTLLASINLKLIRALGLDPTRDGRVLFQAAALGKIVGVPTPLENEEPSEVGEPPGSSGG
jgi:uncharacterized protein